MLGLQYSPYDTTAGTAQPAARKKVAQLKYPCCRYQPPNLEQLAFGSAIFEDQAKLWEVFFA